MSLPVNAFYKKLENKNAIKMGNDNSLGDLNISLGTLTGLIIRNATTPPYTSDYFVLQSFVII